jgi:uncharacterized protein (DUF1501 family)
MKVTRRQFMHGGAAAFTITFAAPEFLSDLARAQGAHARNLVVLYLSGGNDSLSMLVPYNDPFYEVRRPGIFIPAGNVLQVGTDSSKVALGLHPRLTGLRQIFDAGRLALIQRTGYPNQSRSHFQGTDIWATADPGNPSGLGWVGRYLDTLPSPDPLVGWNTTRDLPRVLQSGHTPIAAIPNPSTYAFQSPNSGTPAEAAAERATAARINSHVPVNQASLAFVYASAQAAMVTLDRVATVANYSGTVAYPPNNALAQALKAVAGAMVRGIGTRVFYVTTGGYDTHAAQNPNAGAYANLMTTLNDAVFAFYTDLRNQGLLEDTLVLSFSEFGRRVSENGSNGTDHGAASVMLAMGGRVNGGLYGTAPSLNPSPSNPTLENNGGDVRFETDFRSVYAQVIENWLGASSVAILNGNYVKAGLEFI